MFFISPAFHLFLTTIWHCISKPVLTVLVPRSTLPPFSRSLPLLLLSKIFRFFGNYFLVQLHFHFHQSSPKPPDESYPPRQHEAPDYYFPHKLRLHHLLLHHHHLLHHRRLLLLFLPNQPPLLWHQLSRLLYFIHHSEELQQEK